MRSYTELEGLDEIVLEESYVLGIMAGPGFYETHLGFGALPPRRYEDGVLVLYNADGFSLALGTATRVNPPASVSFGISLPDCE
jgi:hypothetical protein